MHWKRLGRTFDPSALASWMRTHAALPTVFNVDGDVAHVFCAGRDAAGRGQIGAVSISLPGNKLISQSENAVLSHGALGAFDDRGVLPSSIVRTGDGWIMYYTGVMLGKTVPFYFAVGAARSNDGLEWRRVSSAPILDRNSVDPFMTASPCVLFDEGRFRMWYVSCVRWENTEDDPRHYYHIRYAESLDGLTWDRRGVVCIDFQAGEYALARPSVVRDSDCYRMWFPYRGDHYRIGYAESEDGIVWRRDDGASNMLGGNEAWEDEMQCYPWVFDAMDRRYMLYNGNGYGATGFGLAEQVT